MLNQLIIETNLERLFRWSHWFPRELDLVAKYFSENDYEEMISYLNDNQATDLIKYVEKIRSMKC